jgi:hypothetical protein
MLLQMLLHAPAALGIGGIPCLTSHMSRALDGLLEQLGVELHAVLGALGSRNVLKTMDM